MEVFLHLPVCTSGNICAEGALMFSLEIVPPRYHYTNSHQFICLSFSGSSEPNWNSKQQQMSERLKEKIVREQIKGGITRWHGKAKD
jgi:hypothetical protein